MFCFIFKKKRFYNIINLGGYSMTLLSKNELATIERQMYNKGRDIDVALYNYIIYLLKICQKNI